MTSLVPMRSSRRVGHSIIVAILTAVTLILNACGDDEDEDASAAQESVDPRFATAQALLDHFNTLNTRLPPDIANLIPLYHIETDFQRKRLQLLQQSLGPVYDFEVAMYARFGEAFVPANRSKTRACTPAVMRVFGEQRAEGEYKDRWGKIRPLHLIKVGDRWWVSGYTLEYEIDTDRRELVEDVTDFMIDLGSTQIETDYLRPLVVRVQSGEFKDAEDARKAFSALVREHWKATHGSSQ